MKDNGHLFLEKDKLDIRSYDSARLDLIRTYPFVTRLIGLFSKRANLIRLIFFMFFIATKLKNFLKTIPA